MLFDDFLLIRGANLGTGWIVLQWNICMLGHWSYLNIPGGRKRSKPLTTCCEILGRFPPSGLVFSMSCKGLVACPGRVPASPWWVLGKAPAPTPTLTGCTWVGLGSNCIGVQLLLQSTHVYVHVQYMHLLFVIVCMFDNTPAVCIPTPLCCCTLAGLCALANVVFLLNLQVLLQY